VNANPVDRTSWHGKIGSSADGIFERLTRDFPVGSRLAVSATVGTWSHELSVERIQEIVRSSPDHITIVTDSYVRGVYGDDYVAFSSDYRGMRFVANKTNGAGEPIEWILVRIDDVEDESK
jgi:hypothetical protein